MPRHLHPRHFLDHYCFLHDSKLLHLVLEARALKVSLDRVLVVLHPLVDPLSFQMASLPMAPTDHWSQLS